jgi:hypothetical protein
VELGAVSDVEIIELDDDNNVFVDTFSALDSSIAVESGKFAAGDDLAAKFDQITCVAIQRAVEAGYLSSFWLWLTHSLVRSWPLTRL